MKWDFSIVRLDHLVFKFLDIKYLQTASVTKLSAICFLFPGIVGDWKNQFTVAQSEQFDDYWSKAFKASKTFPMYEQD